MLDALVAEVSLQGPGIDTVVGQLETAGMAQHVETFDADDWSIEITLHGGFDKDIPAERMIATAMGDLRIIEPHGEIRQAVRFKGSRYSAITLPYLILVADCKEELQGGRIGDAALEAMFGTIVTDVWNNKGGKIVLKDRHAADAATGACPMGRNCSTNARSAICSD
jgi:hypothetical protein